MLFQGLLFSLCVMLASGGDDDFSNIYRPCVFADISCISDVLADMSKCSKNVKARQQPLYIPQQRYEWAYYNVSVIDSNLMIKNIDRCYFSEFFFDTAAKTFVLGVDCPSLSTESNRTFIYHPKLSTDVYFNFARVISYPLISFTTNLPFYGQVDLCSSFSSAYLSSVPLIPTLTDPRAQQFVEEVLTPFPQPLLSEQFLYLSAKIVRFFINTIICDFRC